MRKISFRKTVNLNKRKVGLIIFDIIIASVVTTFSQTTPLKDQKITREQTSTPPALTLAEKLGFKATDKLLIVNVDDAGNYHSTNVAVFQGMEKGIVTTSTVMVPCAWFPEVVLYQKAHHEVDFGVHLTHREPLLGPCRYPPVAGRNEVPGLYDPDGFFWTTPAQVLAHSNPQEAEIEGRAQIQKALAAGMDISHLDSHTGILGVRPDYFAVYVKLAREFDLPVRFAGERSTEKTQTSGQKEVWNQQALLDDNGILHTDYIIAPSRLANESAKDSWKRFLIGLKPGVTEAYVHACVSTEESQAALQQAKAVPLQNRVEDFEAVTNDTEIRKIIKDQGIILIKWKAIRDLQRKARIQFAASIPEYYTVGLRDERIRIPPTVTPLFDQFMRDTYCTLGPDGWYYLTGTTPAPGRTNIWDWNDGLRLWRSKDLKQWENLGLVFSLDRDGTWQKPFIKVPPGRITMSGERCDSIQRISWTPEIHYIKSKKTWLINACMGSKLDPRRGAFILKSTSGKPEGPYENIEASRNGPINNLPGNFSADNSLFEDNDGTVYFVGVDHYVMKMKDDLSGFAEPPHPLIETPWKHEYYCEGGFIFKHGGKYHLVQTFWSRKRQPDLLEYSQSSTLKIKDDTSTYGYDAIVSSSDNVYGPYGQRYVAVIGGGHLNPFQDAQGRWWGAAFGNPNGQSREVNAFDGKIPYICRPLLIPLKWENDKLMVDRTSR